MVSLSRCRVSVPHLSGPGGQSGVTIGFGYDLGYVTLDQSETDWGELIRPDATRHLKAVVGLRAQRAHNRIGELVGIRVSRDAAEQVFDTRNLALYELRTAQAIPSVRTNAMQRNRIASIKEGIRLLHE